MRLTLICAAAPPGQRRSVFPSDESIDAPGLAELAGHLPRLPAVPLHWCSPTPSAVQTAAAFSWRTTPVPALRECGYGAWAGRRLRNIGAENPDGYRAWLSDPAAAPHGGESIVDVIERVAAWLDGLAATDDAAAVTHASVIRAALIHARGADPTAYGKIDIAPLTLIVLRRDAGRWSEEPS